MKNIRFWQFFTFLILFSVSLKAQNYQPFCKNSYVYRFEGTDEYYKLTVDSVTVSGDDSVFHFNPIVHNLPPDNHFYSECNSILAVPDFIISNENIFGKALISRVDGDYIFLFKQDSFLIKTSTDTNTTWVFSKKLNLTAKIKRKSIENVFGQQDSVHTFELSNKYLFKISKNYGLISGFNFLKSPFYNAGYDVVKSLPDYQLSLVSIPSRNLGLKYPDFYDFFDYQIGDEFGYYAEGTNFLSSLINLWENTRIKILEYSRNNITKEINYKYEYKYFIQSHDMVTFKTEKGTKTLTSTIRETDYPYFASNSLEFTLFSPEKIDGVLSSTPKKVKYFTLDFKNYLYDSCTNLIGSMYDHVGGYSFSQRLGETNKYNCCYVKNLSCYLINNKSNSSGKCVDIDKLLSIEETQEQKTVLHLSPNPANIEISLNGLPKNNIPNSKNLIKIFDIQGKIVHQQIITSSMYNQDKELKIDVSDLQNGLYFLHYISESGSVSSQKFIISK